MRRPHRNHSATFKAKVALAAASAKRGRSGVGTNAQRRPHAGVGRSTSRPWLQLLLLHPRSMGSWWEHSCHINYVPAGIAWDAGDRPNEDSLYLWGPDVPPNFVENVE